MMMKIVVIMVFERGNKILIKKCIGFVLLSWVVFNSLFGMVLKNWWKKNVVVVEVIRGSIKLV